MCIRDSNGGTYSNTTNYTNLAAGTYTIAVKDANGCVFSTTANINSSGGPTAVNVTPTDAGCGQDNGSLSIGNVTGGNAPYTYAINGGTYSNTTNYTNLAAGTYTCLLYTSDAADERSSVDLGGRRIIK